MNNSEACAGRMFVAAQETLPSVLVTGKRASLMSAQEIRRDKAEIVDSVVAEDVDKLPGLSDTDALQRITGVVAIRGLTHVEPVSLAREATNLLRTIRTAYYGLETRPQGAWMNDRQFSLTITIRH